MKALQQIKKEIGKTKNIREEGITASEKFQRIFLELYEHVEKVPPNIKEIFLSNIAYRVFAYPLYQTINQKDASFFKEKIETEFVKYTLSPNAYTIIYLNDILVRRAKRIGIELYNESTNYLCEVHIRPHSAVGDAPSDDLFFYKVQPNMTSFFQFNYDFTTCEVILKTNAPNAVNVFLRFYYTPL